MAVFISIDDTWVNEEDGGATFTVRLSERSQTAVSVTWGLGAMSAAWGSDFIGVSNQTLVFAPGEVERTLFVALRPDGNPEPVETFRVLLGDAVGGTLTRNAGLGMIVDNDTISGSPRISAGDVIVDETGEAHVVVRLDAASTSTVTVGYTTVADSAAAGTDFQATSGTLTFNPGEVVRVVPVGILNDTTPEATERFFFQLSGASGGQIAGDRATVFVRDNDARAQVSPFISIDDIHVSESDALANFTVSLSAPSASAVSMTWGLDALTAAWGSDFFGLSNQTLVFAPGETTKTVSVVLRPDANPEDLESFRIVLDNAVGGTFAKATGTAVIVDNDTQLAIPNITLGDVTVDESGEASVVVRLDGSSASTVSVDYATTAGTAAAGADYAATSGTLTFLPGEVAKTIRIGVTNDTTREGVEQFHVDLSNPLGAAIGTSRGTVTIVDNDAPSAINPLISIDDVWVGEDAAHATFTVSLSAPSDGAVSLRWGVGAGTARWGSDFVGLSNQTLTFAPGEMTKTIHVPLRQDGTDETLESFQVTLSASTGGTIARSTGTAVIVDDDAPQATTPILSVVPTAPTAVGEGGGWIDIPVMLDTASVAVQRVAYTTRSGTAISGVDFVAASGVLAFLPGEVTKTVRVFVREDLLFEGAETFSLAFSEPTTPSLTPSGLPLTATVTITDNEIPIIGSPRNDTLLGRNVPDQLDGRAGNDRLFGYGGDDTLYGREGHDFLDGGAGADLMIGGPGNDTYVLSEAGDQAIERPGQGRDTIISPTDAVLAAEFENLTLTGTGRNATGNASDNVLIGNALVNLLRGLAGNDTLDGGTGGDLMIGGPGNDTYVVDNRNDRIVDTSGVDLVRARIGYALAPELENLELLGNAVTGIGNDGNNRIVGNAAANVLRGLGGNDLLSGGAGADRMSGGRGNDRYYVDNRGDVVIEARGEGRDTVYTNLGSYVLPANVENGELIGRAARLDGNGMANTLWGNAGNNTLIGAGGADTMLGGAGNDIYSVDSARDVVVERRGEGIDKIVSTVNVTLAVNVENATLAGAARNADGNDLDNVLIGTAARNQLRGLGGDDTLSGGTGADRMYGGAGNDLYYVENRGDRTIEGVGQGIDTVRTNRSYTLEANVENGELIGRAAATLVGNGLANALTGNGANNVLRGGDGNDRVSGGAGNDILYGDAGRDILIGGAGADRFVFTAPGHTRVGAGDQIRDFASGIDHIDLRGIDADTTRAGNQAFDYTGSYFYYDNPGQLRFYNGKLEGDLNGDRVADFQIEVTLARGYYVYESDILL